MILLCMRKPVPNSWFSFPFPQKNVYSPTRSVPPPSHLTYMPTKSNLYFEMSSPTTLSEPALYMLLTFHVPNRMSIFFRLGHLSKESVQVWGLFWMFVRSLFFYNEELLVPCPNSKLEDHPLSTVRNCLFSIFAATLQNWRASLPSATRGGAMLWSQGTDSIDWGYLRNGCWWEYLDQRGIKWQEVGESCIMRSFITCTLLRV
jgi:hypothetical protein